MPTDQPTPGPFPGLADRCADCPDGRPQYHEMVREYSDITRTRVKGGAVLIAYSPIVEVADVSDPGVVCSICGSDWPLAEAVIRWRHEPRQPSESTTPSPSSEESNHVV